MCLRKSSMRSSFCVRSVWSELVLDKNCTTSSYVQFPFLLTTPVSWALFVSPLKLVGMTSNNYCPVEWTGIGSSNWNQPSIRWNKVLARLHKQKKRNTNTQLSIAFIWLMTGCNLTPTKDSWTVEYHQSQFHLQPPWMPSSINSFDAIIMPWAKPTKRLTTHPGIWAGGVNSNVQLPTPQHWSDSMPNLPAQQIPRVLWEGLLSKPPFKLFNRVRVHRYLSDTDTTLLFATVSGRCQPCYNHKSVM